MLGIPKLTANSLRLQNIFTMQTRDYPTTRVFEFETHHDCS